MEFVEVMRLAVARLVGQQLDNGSWFNDPMATASATETLCEERGGPDPVCRSSRVHSDLHKTDRGFGVWPWGHSEHPDDADEAVESAIARAFWSVPEDVVFPRDRVSPGDAWIITRWLRIASLTDPDYETRFFRVHEVLRRLRSEESWLMAQIALADLHSSISLGYFANTKRPTERPDIEQRALQILQRADVDHWEDSLVVPEEATAIAGAFLFHECTLHVIGDVNLGSKARALGGLVMTWLLGRQQSAGSWAGSPHVTSHCLRLLDAWLLGMSGGHPWRPAVLDAVRSGVQHLIQPATQVRWAQLDDYQKMDILGVLLRLSKRPELAQAIFDPMDVDGSAFAPDVFISYGGPDVAFAKRLARSLEAAGVRVWFAEWDLDYGDDIVQEIENGLATTTKFVIVLSPEALKRPWVRKELSAAFRQALSGPGKVIIPLMYRHTDPPAFLAANRQIDFTDDKQYAARTQELVRRLKGRKASRT